MTINTFKLGYATGCGLIDFLNENDVNVDDAAYLGLIKPNEDGTCYEAFRNRIMLPIIKSKVIIGFGGRTIIKGPAKYINSKASKLYNKSDTLYGLNFAAKYIAQEGAAILVEGYFDVLGLWDAGIRNVVAGCGTALGELHALLLKRWTDKVYTCYDPDDAGVAAAKKSRKVLGKQGLEVVDVHLPGELDPDEWVKKYGVGEFKKMLI